MIGKMIAYGLTGIFSIALMGGGVYFLAHPDAAPSQAEHPANEQSLVLAGVGSTYSVENPDPGPAGGGGQGNPAQSAYRIDSGSEPDVNPANLRESSSPLSAEEIAGVSALLEEEKLARDVYTFLYGKWEIDAFQNISESEQSHMNALISVLEQAGVSDPTSGFAAGEFPTTAVRELYDQFTTQGGQSLPEAFRAGAAIEEIDILDIEKLEIQTTNSRLLRVFENLRRGSIRHLGAYATEYERETGNTYTPQYLSQETYDVLMSGDSRGSRGNGQRGGRQGKGGK